MTANLNVNPEEYENLVEIALFQPDDFLKIRETLRRMGVPNLKNKTLMQTCYILHDNGRYYIAHFKELFRLDGSNVVMTDEDTHRRDQIVRLLEKWGLLKVLSKLKEYAHNTTLYVLPFKEVMRAEWKLEAVYRFNKVKTHLRNRFTRDIDDERIR